MRMKRNLALVTAVLSTMTVLGCSAGPPAPGMPQAEVSALERALHARSDAFQAAEAALDVERSTAFWAEDALIQPAGMQQIQGREAVRGLYRQFFTGMGIKELKGTATSLVMARSGELAYETGINRILIHMAGGDVLDVGKYLLVWRRLNGEWYASALSFTSDAAAPAPVRSTP